MRFRLNLKTACTTTMPPYFIDITHCDVSAVVWNSVAKHSKFHKNEKHLVIFTQGLFPLILNKIQTFVAQVQLLTEGQTDGQTDDAPRHLRNCLNYMYMGHTFQIILFSSG